MKSINFKIVRTVQDDHTARCFKAASNKNPSSIANISVKSPIKKDNVPVQKNSRFKTEQKSNLESVSKDLTVAEVVQSIPKDLKEEKIDKSMEKNKKKAENISKDNDAESDIFSLLSVSSVHTSELSSFDDAISLSSDYEENGKKKIKLNDLKEMYQSDRISAWCAENFHGSKSRRSSQDTEVSTITEEEEKEPTKEVTKMTTPESSPAPTPSFWTSTPQKILPRRIRKPNSKYISDSILNPITPKQHKREIDSDLRTITAESPLHSPQKRKMMKSGSSTENKETELPIRNQQVASREENNTMNDVKSENQPSSSNLYKPFASVRPLTSRRSTAPVTLFSTCTQHLKK